MSGHNKWSKIKHKKAATDAKRSKEFSKIVRLIKVEARRAMGDVNAPGLKTAIDKAKSVNMPKDNIDRAVKSAATDPEANMESALYESYGPGGVAMVIEALTDNKNRTSAEIKHILSKKGLSLANPGSATWAFENLDDGWEAKTTIDLSDSDLEKLSALVDELEEQEDTQTVYVNVV